MADLGRSLPDGPFPSASDYVAALQNPTEALYQAELRGALPRTGMFDLPAVTTGRNAAVFTLDRPGGRPAVALKAFTSRPSRGPEVYTALDRQDPPKGLVDVSWLGDALLVHGKRWPVVTMPWVEGLTLERWLDTHHVDAARLHRVREQLRESVDDLQRAGIAHGDLQHGNIIVSDDDQVTLVDYDGVMMYDRETGSPLLPPPSEAGHPNYQHPERIQQGGATRHADTFAATLIDLSLAAIANEPSLYRGDGNSLVLTAEDLEDPDGGGAQRFDRMAQALDPEHRPTLARLREWSTRSHDLPHTRAEFEVNDVLGDLGERVTVARERRTAMASFEDTEATGSSQTGGAGYKPATNGSVVGWAWAVAIAAALFAVFAMFGDGIQDFLAGSQPNSQSSDATPQRPPATPPTPRPEPTLEWRIGACVRFVGEQGDLVPCSSSNDAIVVQHTSPQQCSHYYWPEENTSSSLWFDDASSSSRVFCVAPRRDARVMDYRPGACLRESGSGLMPVPCSTWHDFSIESQVSDPYLCPDFYLEDGWQYWCLRQ